MDRYRDGWGKSGDYKFKATEGKEGKEKEGLIDFLSDQQKTADAADKAYESIFGQFHVHSHAKKEEAEAKSADFRSGLDKYLLYVMSKLGRKGVKVYVSLSSGDDLRFQAEFLATFAFFEGKKHTTTYITSKLSMAMNEEQVSRECDITIKALAQGLAMSAFVDESPHVPTGAIQSMEHDRR